MTEKQEQLIRQLSRQMEFLVMDLVETGLFDSDYTLKLFFPGVTAYFGGKEINEYITKAKKFDKIAEIVLDDVDE